MAISIESRESSKRIITDPVLQGFIGSITDKQLFPNPAWISVVENIVASDPVRFPTGAWQEILAELPGNLVAQDITQKRTIDELKAKVVSHFALPGWPNARFVRAKDFAVFLKFRQEN